ncbi:MAG: tetratricopeptide repeat protein [Thermodesulfobacteriota bacterium]
MRYHSYCMYITLFFLLCGLAPARSSADAQTAKELFDEAGRLAEKGNMEQAQPLFDKAIQLDPSMAGLANFRLGTAFAQQQNFTEAVKYYEKALESKKNEPIIYMNMANAYLALHRPDRAVDCYKRITELDPKAVWAYHNLGSLYLQMKAYPSAVEAFNKVIEIDANTFRTVYEQIGYAYQMMRNFDQAILAYQKAIKVNPKSFAAHYNLGKCYFDLREADNAIKSYTTAIELDPKSAEAITNLGHAYYYKYTISFARSDLDLASAAFNRALMMKKDLGQALFGLSLVNRERGEYQTALDLAERAKQSGLKVSSKYIENLQARIEKKPLADDPAAKPAIPPDTKEDTTGKS